MGTILYGHEFAKDLRVQLKDEISQMVQLGKRCPQLAILHVGEDEGSTSYILSTQKSCANVGIAVQVHTLEETITVEEFRKVIEALNDDETVDGIIIQMPLPKHLPPQVLIDAMDPSKDVDGLHSDNIAKLYTKKEGMLPCTPQAIMKMLEYANVPLSGKEAVVIGRSQSVGRPVAQLLLNENATVTVCHSKTKNMAEVVRRADVVVVAIGKAKLITKEYFKEGAIVIDVGVNIDEQGKLCGDVDFADVLEHVAQITPVPKGLGPVTTAMLMENVLKSYRGRV